MVDPTVFESLADDELLTTVRRLTARANIALADLLAHLGELERRGIHRARGCASLYTYLIYELRMSEDAAFRRAKAARLVREYPEVQAMVAKGELHLTGLLMIGPHLGGERHAEILERARFRTKREIVRLIAMIDPKPEVPALVEPLGPASPGPATYRSFSQALAGSVRALPEGQRPQDWIEPGNCELGDDPKDMDAVARDETGTSRSEAERPLRYKVQFTAGQEYVDLLKEAIDLLSHEMPRAELPDVQLRAMRELLRQLRRRKRSATDRPRSSGAAPEGAGSVAAPAREPSAAPERERPAAKDVAPVREPSAAPERERPAAKDVAPVRGRKTSVARTRHIPAWVQRSVWARDGERCAYVDGRGKRCQETRFLELHHRRAHALGGPPATSNLEVRCRAHNTLAAEQDFGRSYMDRVRGVHGGTTPLCELGRLGR